MILSWVNNIYGLIFSLSKSNPLIAGAISLWGLGVVTYVFKDIPSRIWRFIAKQCTTQLSVNSSDSIYYDLLRWVTEEKMHGFVRTLSFSNSTKYAYKSSDSMMAMGYGRQWFRLGWRPMFMDRVRDTANQTAETKETITITALGRSHAIFTNLFNIIHKKEKEDTSYIRIYTWKTDGWILLTKQYKRPINTVAIPKVTRDRLTNYIQSFLNSKDWNIQNGIPWRTGILMDGPPGTGKTSLIKALCSYFNKNLYLVDLNAMSDSSLRNALSYVPEGAVVAIEDIDATPINQKRTDLSSDKSFVGLTLSGVLNAIDGPASSEGRILIATTNHPEKLDPALVREGRFDLKIHVGYLNNDSFQEYMNRIYPNFPEINNWKIKENIAPCIMQALVIENKENPLPVLQQIATYNLK